MKFLKGCFTLIGALFVLGIISAIVFGSQNNQNSSNPTSTTATQEAQVQQSNNQKAIAKGSWVDVRNDRAIKIDRSETVDQIGGNQFIKPVNAKGGKLLVVYLTLKNTGNESGNMFWTQFQLVDSQGRKYKEIEDFEEIVSINAWLSEQGWEDAGSQLFPGATAQTAKVFRVSPDAAGLMMDVSGKRLGI